MVGYGRENPKDNDLFFTCSLIDYIARKTKNERVEVVNQLGKKRLAKIYELADIYHSDNIDRVSDDFIREAGIQTGTFDNVKTCGYAIPSHWDIGKVYKRLIKGWPRRNNAESWRHYGGSTTPLSAEKSTITTAACITKILRIFWNAIWKIK